MTLIYLDGLNGINYHRLMTPFLRMKEEHGINIHFFENFNELKDWDLSIVDNLIVSRRCSVSSHKEFKKFLNKHDIKLILDNDDFWELPEDNPAKKFYDKVEAKNIVNSVKIADEIWTTTDYLANRMRMVGATCEIRVIPNTVYEKEKQWRVVDKDPNPERKVRFGFVGANGHSNDIRTMGMDFEGREFYCMNLMDYPQITKAKYLMNPLEIHQYGELYKFFDVSIAPLKNTKFNRCKSELKVLEAGYTKTAIIASNMGPYKNTIQHGKTGILCNSPAEWREAVDKMTLTMAQDLAENLYEYCRKNYDINELNKERLKGLSR